MRGSRGVSAASEERAARRPHPPHASHGALPSRRGAEGRGDRCRLYLVTPPALDPPRFAEDLAAALDAGDVAAVQLRLKEADDDALRRACDVLRPVAQRRGVAFLLNDRPDLAAETGCDGVHVGQEDAPYEEARRIMGSDRIVGVTAHDSRHLAMEAAEAGADYVAFGAFSARPRRRRFPRRRQRRLEPSRRASRGGARLQQRHSGGSGEHRVTGISLRFDERGVAEVTIDHAGKLNILDRALMAELVAATERLAAAEGLRAIVLRGAGDKAFIGGADLREMAALDAASAAPFITALHQVCDGLRRLPVPVVARIDGYALGAGLEIAASCDLRIASDRTVFGMPEVRVGIPSVIEAALLPRLIGWGRARRLLLTGETIGAAEAERWGLVERVVPAAALDDAVAETLAQLLAAGPRALALQKALMRDWEEGGVIGAIERGISSFAEAFTTDEPRRMMRAFLDARERRK